MCAFASQAHPGADRNLEHQQDVPGLGLPIVVLRARSNDSNDVVNLEPLMPAVLALLPALMPGRVAHLPE